MDEDNESAFVLGQLIYLRRRGVAAHQAAPDHSSAANLERVLGDKRVIPRCHWPDPAPSLAEARLACAVTAKKGARKTALTKCQIPACQTFRFSFSKTTLAARLPDHNCLRPL